MRLDRNCIVFTGGGTGGHVYPGLAVIEALRRQWPGRIVWIGSGKAVEREAVEQAGVEFLSISSGKFRRSLSLRNFSDLFRILAGFFQSVAILRRLKPCLLFSKGGYVSVPPCAAAAFLKIPYFTHESDVSPGLATRLNAGSAAAIFVSWQDTLQYLKPQWQRKSLIAGNPVRAAIATGDAARGRRFLGSPDALPLILVLGGSQGAEQVNKLIQSVLPELAGKAFVAHQTGSAGLPCRPADSGYKGFAYLHQELPDVYAAATVIVGRAGAGTIWEACAARKPLILIPLYGPDTRGDQVHNTRLLQSADAALGLIGDEATPENLLTALTQILHTDGRADKLVERASAVMNPNAAADIAAVVLSQIGRTAI
ncbi:MAG: undecaprenyldiphospho-muramoylpentapeptide beta-N-acetylglucosaminyltransferase [Spirochaetes bacterium]|nr:undecaprenyldiphospho-muramoylpentapeptide beta-N-acetylglucosaminyltransferase [Spirochaetota bacterium]MBU0957028.1 undecaprenyldiphospho-muramoylpentapeptide beta-N-acetylglucosaminyltransferase [Spirochaetota bacterium]